METKDDKIVTGIAASIMGMFIILFIIGTIGGIGFLFKFSELESKNYYRDVIEVRNDTLFVFHIKSKDTTVIDTIAIIRK